jgi:ring-1,2-phenylacetyl-CoA epoxidase subunit PaaE
MIAAVSDALAGFGVDPARVHVEHFTLETVAVSERSEQTPTLAEGSAEVTVVMDGRRRSFSMALGDETVLEAALSAGIDLPYSCCAGVCSTCRTKAVSGDVDMADNFALEDWELEQGYVLACQSRPLGEVLVLDYDDV